MIEVQRIHVFHSIGYTALAAHGNDGEQQVALHEMAQAMALGVWGHIFKLHGIP